MRLIIFILFLVLIGCKTQPIKTDTHDYDFYYGNTITGENKSYHNDLDLRVYVSAAKEFNNRLEQIEWALEITSLALNTELSDYNFKDLPPSPYLSINKLISIKHYLRLAGFNKQKIVVDPVNNMVIYLNRNNPFFINNSFSDSLSTLNEFSENKPNHLSDQLLSSDDTNTSQNEPENAPVNSPDDIQIADNLTNVVENDDVDLFDQTEPLNQSEPDDSLQVLDVQKQQLLIKNEKDSGNINLDSNNEPLSITVNTDSVIDQPVITELRVSSGQTLREIFTYLATKTNLNFVSSLGRYDWFLDSTINHEYVFKDLDHALFLLLDESNNILTANDLGFMLKFSLNNGLLDVYYE